jgi:mevalonate kinase
MQKNFAQLGLLMDNNQKLLSTLRVSSKELDNLIRSTREVGAYGAKLSGAGGGDCMVAFCPEEKLDDAGSAIERAGGIWMKVKTGAEGVKLEL